MAWHSLGEPLLQQLPSFMQFISDVSGLNQPADLAMFKIDLNNNYYGIAKSATTTKIEVNAANSVHLNLHMYVQHCLTWLYVYAAIAPIMAAHIRSIISEYCSA